MSEKSDIVDDLLGPCTTTDGRMPSEARALQTNAEGQHDSYIVLKPEERAKGFVRPVRTTYKHVGERPTYPTQPLTTEQHARYDQFGYVAFEAYPDGSPESCGGSHSGRYWTAAHLASCCGGTTSMGTALAETYARDPKFYGSTFCLTCNKHFPVAEFVWYGTTEVVGS